MAEQAGEYRSINNLLESARSRIARHGPEAALEAMRDGALIIDTRCVEQRRETGVIPGSVHVPLSVLFWRLDASSGHADARLVDPGREIILVCAHGYSTSLAAATLRDLGFERAGDLIGGFEAWRDAGLPVEPLNS